MRNRQGENVRVKIRFDQIYYQQTSWPNDYHWRNFVNFHLSDIFYKQILDLFKPEFKSTLYGIENRLKTPLESARILPHIPDQKKALKKKLKLFF